MDKHGRKHRQDKKRPLKRGKLLPTAITTVLLAAIIATRGPKFSVFSVTINLFPWTPSIGGTLSVDAPPLPVVDKLLWIDTTGTAYPVR